MIYIDKTSNSFLTLAELQEKLKNLEKQFKILRNYTDEEDLIHVKTAIIKAQKQISIKTKENKT